MRRPAPFIPGIAAVWLLAGCGGGPHSIRPDEEWRPPRAILLQYDANHDGSVTRAELEAGLRADFKRADKNGDGVLEPDEVEAVNQERWKADASTASPLIDWNHDGVIDFNDFAAMPRSLFDQLDTDGDGVLTPKELNLRAAPPLSRTPPPGARSGAPGN